MTGQTKEEKTMTREEAIRILASSCIPGSKQTEALETLIPELAESEDERIRKEIISALKFANDGGVYDKHIAYLEKQKEQKPVESISQLTVQGKGVYKICPRCKERMVRDDSMVYTSMPPQYRYECPKCGESECDTVMYDNPEMEKQKPAEKHDLVAQLKEHLANTPKEQLEAEWKELEKWNHVGPTVEEYLGSIKPAEWSDTKELVFKDICNHLKEEGYSGWVLLLNALRNGEFQPKQEWSEEDQKSLNRAINICISDFGEESETARFLKSLPGRFNLQPKTEWSEEDEKMLKWIEDILFIADGDLSDKLNGKVSPITDSAYSSMKLCIAKCLSWLKSLPLNLKKKNEDVAKLCSNEWSEEDEACIRNLESIIYYDKKLPNDTRVILGEFLSNLRPQPKKELSIEKAIQWLDDTFYFLDNSSGRGRDCEITTHDFDSLEEMYDSFRKAVIVDSEPHWKPSEEQMKALLNAEGFLRAGLQHDSAKTIAELYEHLKKLGVKEEPEYYQHFDPDC